jgi:hypothetical protein
MEPFIKIEIFPNDSEPYPLAKVLSQLISSYRKDPDLRSDFFCIIYPDLIDGKSSGFIKFTTNCSLVDERVLPHGVGLSVEWKLVKSFRDRIFAFCLRS